MKLNSIQSLALWAATCSVGFAVYGALNPTPLQVGYDVPGWLMTGAFVSVPTWLLWRMSCFLWKCASILSMAVSTKHQRMRDEREVARW